MMRLFLPIFCMLSLAAPAAAEDGRVRRGDVVRGQQYYLDGQGRCFAITPSGEVEYRSIDCRPGRFKGAGLGPVIDGKQYYRDDFGNCYYVQAEGRRHYPPQGRC